MADTLNEKVTADIVRNTVHEIELLFSAVWNLIAISINPFRNADDTKTATEAYISAIPGLARDILQNASLLISGNLHGTGQVLFTVVEQELAKIGPDLVSGWHDLLKNYLTLFAADVVKKKIDKPEEIEDAFASALDRASLFGVGSRLVTMIFELFLPKKMNTFNWLGPQLSELSGYDKILEAWREPMFDLAYRKQAEYHWNSKFKPLYPDESDAVTWNSRGLLKDGQLDDIFKYSGLRLEFEEAFKQSAFRPVSAFIMLRLLESGAVDSKTVNAALKFNGYRDTEIKALEDYGAWAAASQARGSYYTQVISAAERGILSDAEVDDALNEMDKGTDAHRFVHLAIATRKLQQLADLYRKSIDDDYKFGFIDDAQYMMALESIGISEADADAHHAIVAAEKKGKEAALAAREAAREAALAVRLQTAAAVAGYQQGTLNAGELAAALIVAGNAPINVPYIVAVQTARRDMRKAYTFGVKLDRQAAQLLRERVAALKEQVIKHELDPASALVQMKSWGIPDKNAADLAAEWEAQALKTLAAIK